MALQAFHTRLPNKMNGWGMSRLFHGAAHNAEQPMPAGWFRSGSHPGDYDIGKAQGDAANSLAGQQSPGNAVVIRSRGDAAGYGALTQNIRANRFRGKRICLSAQLCSRDVENAAGLWLRVDGDQSQVLSFDDMSSRPIIGTTQWRRHEVVLDVPEESKVLAFGILLRGPGTLWAAGLTLEPVPNEMAVTAMKEVSSQRPYAHLLPQSANLDFSVLANANAGADAGSTFLSRSRKFQRPSLRRAMIVPLITVCVLAPLLIMASVPFLQERIAVELMDQTLSRQAKFLSKSIRAGTLPSARPPTARLEGRGNGAGNGSGNGGGGGGGGGDGAGRRPKAKTAGGGRNQWIWQYSVVGNGTTQSSFLISRGWQLPTPSDISSSRWQIVDRKAFARPDVPFDVVAPDGTRYRMLRSTIYRNSRDAGVELVIAGPSDKYIGRARALWNRIAPWLALSIIMLILGILFAQIAQLRHHLRPLERLRQVIGQGNNKNRAIDVEALPKEVMPLVKEFDAIIEEKNLILERSYGDAENLAHALKTPIAILRNEIPERDNPSAKIMRDQLDDMNASIEHYLYRPRLPKALAGMCAPTTIIHELLEDLKLTTLTLHKGKALDISTPNDTGLKLKCDPDDVIEALGALIDNACIWAKHKVKISLGQVSERLVISIEDDGPGIAAGERSKVLRRGVRLDESKPGSGFGLDVTTQIASSYGGQVLLERSHLGGLLVHIDFPLG